MEIDHIITFGVLEIGNFKLEILNFKFILHFSISNFQSSISNSRDQRAFP